MKIFGKKSLSSILQVVFKFAFYMALIQGIVISIWIGLGILFYTLGIKSSIAELILEGERFQLVSSLIDGKIQGHGPYYITLLAIIGVFIGFILLFKWLAELFKEFSSGSIFRQSVTTFLYRLTLLMVGAISYRLIILICYSSINVDDRLFLIFNIFCAILFYFIAKLIEQGIPLQEEQELII